MRTKRSSQALLAVLLCVLFVFPLLEQERRGALFVMQAVFTLVLLGGLYSASASRRTFVVGLALFVPAILLGWVERFVDRPAWTAAAYVLNAVALAYIVAVVSAALMRARRVSFETIAAAVSVYLVLGILWSIVYRALLLNDPTCIAGLSEGEGARAAAVFYFSFVTLTTLGYGDILPVSGAARGFVTLEAIVGQIYLTVMIARLVGLHLAAPADD